MVKISSHGEVEKSLDSRSIVAQSENRFCLRTTLVAVFFFKVLKLRVH